MDAKEQHLSHVLYWAKTVVENTRSEIGWNDEEMQTDECFTFPSWLREMEAAIEAAENEGAEAIEP